MAADAPIPPDVTTAILRLCDETFLATVDWFAEIDSTNSQALALLREQPETVNHAVWAAQQMAGRGRGQNRWWSEAGALTVSLIVDPRQFGLTRAQWPQLSLTTGLAVCRAMGEFAADGVTSLKWPNDVYFNGRKLGGILIESPGGPLDRLVIGIGLNVQNSLKQAPAEIRSQAASLCDDTASPAQPVDVLIAVLDAWKEAARQLAETPERVHQAWNDFSLLNDRMVAITTTHADVMGRCVGIDANGALRVQLPTGPQTFTVGRVRLCE